MKLTFLAGRAGTGKTHAVFDRIAENERAARRSILIVPDRATFETERALSERLGGGIIYTYVLSFTSLARRVMSETGSGLSLLSSQGRQMLVRRTVEENASELTAFASVAKRKGFSSECDEMILRCKRYSITPDALDAVRDELPPALAAKLHDFSLIYEKTLESMADRYIDSEDLVNSLIDRLPTSSLCGSEVFIDAPDSLSAQSVRIISALMDIMPRMTISLRMDVSGRCRDARLFEPDMNAYIRLRDIAREKGAETEFIPFTGQHRLPDPALSHLERNLFAFPYYEYRGRAENIELHTACSRLAEVTAAAEELRRAAENGMRYRDMAVIVSDTEGYANTIKRVFRAYEIPFFMDVKRPVCSHPISELLLSALRCAEKGLSGADLVRVAKTGLAGVETEQAELLENFILKYGLNGRRLAERFDAESFPKESPELLETVELARAAAVEPISELRERLSGRLGTERDGSEPQDDTKRTADAKQRTEALFAYMERIGLAERLKANCEWLAASGREELARENAQVYDTVVELLDQLHIILGSDRVSLKKFRAVIEEGLRAYSVGIIPSTLDRVFIGDVDKSSVQSYRFIQALGVNDGMLPKAKPDNSVINDSELDRLRGLGLPVWDSSRSMNMAEELRVYSALCMATERLRLSYIADASDESSAPSSIIVRIAELFPNCRRTDGFRRTGGSTNASAFKGLTSALRKMVDTDGESPAPAELYAHFAADADYSKALRTMEGALFPNNSPGLLGRDDAIRLYGRHFSGTATRLETFNGCPFKHYMQFGFGLREREEQRERGIERGIFIHNALETLLRTLLEEFGDPSFIDEKAVAEHVKTLLPELAAEHNNGIYLSTARKRAEFRRLAELLYVAVCSLVKQIAAGIFRPVGHEISFGRRGDAFPALDIASATGEHFRVCGIVDRLDSFVFGGEEFIRVIDYKSFAPKFDFAELASGLKLQLPLYAAAMEAAFEAERHIRTAGLYYVYIGEPNLSRTEPAKVLDEVQKAFTLNGLTLSDADVLYATDSECQGFSKIVAGVRFLKSGGFSGETRLADAAEMENTLLHAKRTAANTLTAIMQGRAEISPSLYGRTTACDKCPFRGVCRFDTTAGDGYRHIRAVTANEFFEREPKAPKRKKSKPGH